MGWAIAHFWPWVATQELCHDRLGLTHSLGCVGQARYRTCASDMVSVCARHRSGIRCRDTKFGVTTEEAAGASGHGFWCRDQKASLWVEVVSRHSFCCRNTVWRIWCRDTILVLQHGLASLGSRPEIGVAT